jgi:hypothetical protein
VKGMRRTMVSIASIFIGNEGQVQWEECRDDSGRTAAVLDRS